jgi:hypothetical protein
MTNNKKLIDIQINNQHLKQVLINNEVRTFLYTDNLSLIFTHAYVNKTLTFLYANFNYIGYIRNDLLNDKILKGLKKIKEV